MTTDADAQARARALSSPLRLRILRLCAFESRTNKELAELLDMNPGTVLHHVRTLTQTGFLAAEAARSGAQGAREIPYRATGSSWGADVPGTSPVLVETFLQGLDGVDPEAVETAWLGLKLNAQHLEELRGRVAELLEEFRARPHDDDGEAYSIFVALHPDRNPPRV